MLNHNYIAWQRKKFYVKSIDIVHDVYVNLICFFIRPMHQGYSAVMGQNIYTLRGGGGGVFSPKDLWVSWPMKN